MPRFLLLLLVCQLSILPAHATLLYAISGDDSGIPRRLNQIDTLAQTITPVFDLGDGSEGYYGLTFANDTLYSVASNPFGVSTLHSFTLADSGSTNALFSLGTGFVGGIAASSGSQIYALGNTFTGQSQLFSLDLLSASATLLEAALPFGLAGGLTWDADSSLLYALGSDFSFVQTVFSIDPTVPGSAIAVSNPVGMGTIGGIHYGGADELYAIGNENGFSELLDVSIGGNAVPLFGLAPVPSFTFSALSGGPPEPVTPTIPEPPILWLMLLAVAAMVQRVNR